jgi:hypothetical protein
LKNGRILKGMRDIRSMRAVGGHSKPNSEEAVYMEMHRLVGEKGRITKELSMWRANVDRLEKRLVDIETQMQEMEKLTAQARLEREVKEGPEWEEITMTY